ncbi:MAG: hypothetical protein PVI90_04305 [Desulfobacteraceae bacterium]|jgi:hypothetical protein
MDKVNFKCGDCGCKELDDNDVHDHKHHRHKNSEIEVYVHENATIASGAYAVVGEYQKIENHIKTQLKEIAIWVDKQGGLIGHIKAYLKRGQSGVLLSITDFDGQVSVKRNQNVSVQISITAIVFNITQEQLQTKVAEVINAIKQLNDDE